MEKLNIKNIKYQESLKLHCTMHVGGVCKYYIEPQDESELLALVRYCKKNNIKYFLLGNGSNVIFEDCGFDGMVICTKQLKNIAHKKSLVKVQCGCNLYVLNNYLIQNNFSGMEWSYGIPGTVGGAVCMNAGAYGGQMHDVVEKVKIFDGEKTRVLYSSQLNFGYRDSIFKNSKYIVLCVWLKLRDGKKDDILALCKSYFSKRKISQPLEFFNSGSIFKKYGETSSGKLIDNLGLKGAKINGAQVSKLHANFIINTGDATSQDIKQLIAMIKQKVKQKYFIDLEEEVIFVGD